MAEAPRENIRQNRPLMKGVGQFEAVDVGSKYCFHVDFTIQQVMNAVSHRFGLRCS